MQTDEIASHLMFFRPSAERARLLDQRMRDRLAASLDHIFSECAGKIPLPPKGQRADCLARIRNSRFSPFVFGAYYELVSGILDNDLEIAQNLIEEIVVCPAHSGGLRLLPFQNPEENEQARRYMSLLDTDPAMPFSMAPPSPRLFNGRAQEIRDGMALLRRADPELMQEIEGLLTEIVLAVPSPGSPEERMEFDGASTFLLWGGAVFNIASPRPPVGVAQQIVHESAHNLLFGLSIDGPLTLGGVDYSYESPLRDDLRPIDGVYHATFVLARMFHVCERLLAAGGLPAAARAECEHARAAHRSGFFEGWSTLQDSGGMTEKGAAIMQAAYDYMSGMPAELSLT